MTKQEITKLIQQGEGLSLEFKESRRALNRDIYETICAFLNRHGGTLLLGVKNNGDVIGIEPDALMHIKQDLVNTLNNPQKISPPAYLSIEEIDLDEKKILHIYVPESSQVHRCGGKIFDRNEDGDFNITDQTHGVAQLYQRKQNTFTETIYGSTTKITRGQKWTTSASLKVPNFFRSTQKPKKQASLALVLCYLEQTNLSCKFLLRTAPI